MLHLCLSHRWVWAFWRYCTMCRRPWPRATSRARSCYSPSPSGSRMKLNCSSIFPSRATGRRIVGAGSQVSVNEDIFFSSKFELVLILITDSSLESNLGRVVELDWLPLLLNSFWTRVPATYFHLPQKYSSQIYTQIGPAFGVLWEHKIMSVLLLRMFSPEFRYELLLAVVTSVSTGSSCSCFTRDTSLPIASSDNSRLWYLFLLI